MPNLILVRHGQSAWNLEKRFTGWVDVDLTGQGKLEACKSGEDIKKLNMKIVLMWLIVMKFLLIYFLNMFKN